MSANRIFLVCSHHKNPEDALCIASRYSADGAFECNINAACRCLGKCNCAEKDRKRVLDWFEKHKSCGAERGRDHFQIAYGSPQDWDQSKPAEQTVAGGVRLGIINGSKQ